MYRTNRKKSTSDWIFLKKLLKFFALNGEKGVSFGKISNTQKSLTEFFTKVPAPSETITVALETDTHSAWISRLLEERGHEVVVAHARDLAFIYKGDKKVTALMQKNWQEWLVQIRNYCIQSK